MLRWRLISSAVIIAVLLVLIRLDLAHNFGRPGVWLAPLAIALGLLAASECLALMRAAGLRPMAWSVYAGSGLVVTLSCAPVLWKTYPLDCPLGKLGWALVAVAAALGLAISGEVIRFRKPGGITQNLAASVLVTCYLGVLLAFLVNLRLFHDNAWGMAALLSLIIVVKLSDSGAYAVGRLIGTHKMAPRLSPGKTIEGAIGGMVIAMLAAWATFFWLVPRITGQPAQEPWWAVGVYGLVLAAVGMLGDLAVSLLKRDAQLKDSSHWIRGLGGVLDILDSVLAAAPAAYLCWAIGLVGPRV